MLKRPWRSLTKTLVVKNAWQVSPRNDRPLELIWCWFELAPGFYHDHKMVIFPLNRSTQLVTNSTQVVKVVLHYTWIPVCYFKHRPRCASAEASCWRPLTLRWWAMMATRQHFSALVTSASMAREILRAGFRTFNINEFLFNNKMQKPTHISVQICVSICLVLSCPVLSIGLSACLPIYLSKSNLI